MAFRGIHIAPGTFDFHFDICFDTIIIVDRPTNEVVFIFAAPIELLIKNCCRTTCRNLKFCFSLKSGLVSGIGLSAFLGGVGVLSEYGA